MRRLRLRLRRLAVRLRVPGRRRGNGGWAPLMAGALLLLLLLTIALRLTPTVREMAEAAVKNSVTQAVNNAIGDKMSSGELDYSSLITLEKDSEGKVTALVCNMARANCLKTEITDDIIARLSDKNTTRLGVPIGNLVGGSLLSGKGLRIPVRILSVSSVETDFKNEFSTSGINQTRHRIVIAVSITVGVMVPGKNMTAEICTSVAVAESIIVGGVPDSYTYFESDEKWDENLERFDITT